VIFHSYAYLLFFTALLAVYWCLPQRWQNWLLLAASYYFYGCVTPWWLIPFAFTTVVDYWCGRCIEERPQKRRAWLIASLISNLSLLSWFKYRGFFLENVQALWHSLGWGPEPVLLGLVVPAGISFYTFQSIGYIMDVYRGELKACKRFDDFAVFVSFFPQLVAGPINRAGTLLVQVQRQRVFPWETVTASLTLILWGLMLKLVVADNAAMIVSKVFSLAKPSFPILWAGVFAFAVQILADFSAYTNIARGSAQLLGFELVENFRHPYIAVSPADFWRRWHISLSTWMRDYVYISLGGNRDGAKKATRNVLLTFLISGAWHGASWNYILWGLYWGVLVAADNLWGKRPRPPRWLAMPLMFAVTCVGWLMFREQDFSNLLHDFKLNPWTASAEDWRIARFLVASTAIYALPIVCHALWDEVLKKRLPALNSLGGEILVSLLAFCFVLVLRSESSSAFIYFQF
jgi:alginate O-acetyltransferase complex protein AlgI